jgi:hypothetical protein
MHPKPGTFSMSIEKQKKEHIKKAREGLAADSARRKGTEMENWTEDVERLTIESLNRATVGEIPGKYTGTQPNPEDDKSQKPKTGSEE